MGCVSNGHVSKVSNCLAWLSSFVPCSMHASFSLPELKDGQEDQIEKLHALNAFGVEAPGCVKQSSSMPSPFPKANCIFFCTACLLTSLR